jgi:hypothetical protein
MRRSGRKVHHTLESCGLVAVGVAQACLQDCYFLLDRNAAPRADGESVILRLARTVEGQEIHRFAVGKQFNALVSFVTNYDAHSRRTRVVIDFGEQEACGSIAHGQPVGFGPCSIGIAARLFVDACNRRFPAIGQDCMEVGHHQATALTAHEAGVDRSGVAGGAAAIDELTAFR